MLNDEVKLFALELFRWSRKESVGIKKKKLVIYYKFFMTVSALKQMPFSIHTSVTLGE